MDKYYFVYVETRDGQVDAVAYTDKKDAQHVYSVLRLLRPHARPDVVSFNMSHCTMEKFKATIPNATIIPYLKIGSYYYVESPRFTGTAELYGEGADGFVIIADSEGYTYTIHKRHIVREVTEEET